MIIQFVGSKGLDQARANYASLNFLFCSAGLIKITLQPLYSVYTSYN